jgi:hypothetical protein
MDGVAAVGIGVAFARNDHVHPVDTSRYAATNPSGFQTASQVTASLAPYLPLAGGVMLGALTLAADPASALQSATKQYVDARSSSDPNRLINGAMILDQRHAGVSVSPANSIPLYTVDRWVAFNTPAGSKFTIGRNNNGATPNITNGFQYFLGVQSSSAYTPAAGDQFNVSQALEADDWGDLNWGAGGARSIVLSFWAYSSLTGNFSGSVQNYAATRSYPFTYSIGAANIWTKIAITIPGDTAGVWVNTGYGAGAAWVNFDLGSGATFRAASGAWAAGDFTGATGALNVVATNAAKWAVTGVKLEAGLAATTYIIESSQQRIARCQRYYCKSYNIADPPGTANQNGATAMQVATGTTGMFAPVSLPVRMRGAPTITTYSVGVANSPGRVTTSAGEQNSGVNTSGESSFSAGYGGSTSMSWINFQWTAEAEL